MRPFRIVLLWQVAATAALALVAAIPWGIDGALSAMLGGAINATAGGAYGLIVSRSRTRSAGEALRTMFRGEAVKILLIIVLLWLVMSHYRAIVYGAFLGTFALTLALFAAAIAVRNGEQDKPARADGL